MSMKENQQNPIKEIGEEKKMAVKNIKKIIEKSQVRKHDEMCQKGRL